jgi:hypothetical protein
MQAEEVTAAIYTYLQNTPPDQRWGEGDLLVKVELHTSGTNGVLFLSTGAPRFGGMRFLERALARVRHGFEQDEIDGCHGSLEVEPEQVWTHDDAEAKRTLLTLAIGITVKPTSGDEEG